MRVWGQLTVIAVLGGLGYGAWFANKEGYLEPYRGIIGQVPGVNAVLPPPQQNAQAGQPGARPGGAPGAPGARGPGGPGGGAPPIVEVGTVKTGRIVETREAVGTVRAFESITVTAKVAGIIDKIDFEEGAKVKAGDVLVTLDAVERRADIEAALAESRRASAQRNEIATRLDRARQLRSSGSGTEAQVEDLTAQVRTLESAIASAEARRKAAEARLEDLIIRAPFAGRVGTRSVSLGAYVAPNTRITTLDDLSKVRLDFSVPENLLGRLKAGQVVKASSAAFQNRVFEGKVAVVDTRVDPVTRTVRLTADFPNGDEVLKPGMFLSVALEVTNKEDAVVVPEESVVSEGLRHVVYPVKDNKVERRVIRIGQRQNGQIEVMEGLQPGETIVVLGLQRVRPGATVNARPVGAPPPPAARRDPATTPGAPPAARSTLNPVGTANAADRS
ncbi:MAG TPA: efflux RND transporter periplasmic adaptor subunit [Microvirga sp.]|jgi:membrane fusion protein (multidrug efflux system)|nr:efflux RND transporter periplasmic adaptor subunit [Microvirga sp.]